MPRDHNPLREMSLIGHLEELRSRLIVAIVALALAFFVAFAFAKPVAQMLIEPVASLVPDPKPVPEGEADYSVRVVVGADGTVRVSGPPMESGAGDEEAGGSPEPATVRELTLVVADADSTRTFRLASGAEPSGPKIFYPDPLGPFMVQLKVALILAILLALPVWVHQIWLFVAPGLTDKEKKVVRPLLGGTLFLFPVGALFAYFMIYMVVRFMRNYVVEGVDTMYDINAYLKFMTTMMLVFGIIFELPMILALLARVGIVTPAFLSHYRRHIYVGLAVFSMIITPADPFSMLLAFGPLVVLFELSFWIVRPMSLMWARDDVGENASS